MESVTKAAFQTAVVVVGPNKTWTYIPIFAAGRVECFNTLVWGKKKPKKPKHTSK